MRTQAEDSTDASLEPKQAIQTPRHGGDLAYATNRFGQPRDGWQDLSTGISPWPYPLPALPPQYWHHLPTDNRDLLAAAARYYGIAAQFITPLPGSQVAIAQLPELFQPAVVAVPALGYSEHHIQWCRVGHKVRLYSTLDECEHWILTGQVNHVVVINPNNPSGESVPAQRLQNWAEWLSGALVVDEAFTDCDTRHTMVPFVTSQTNVWVLRSLGKFFGLAGARLGFLIGAQPEKIQRALDPWAVSGPALWAGAQALQDSQWQDAQRLRIKHNSERLYTLLRQTLPGAITLHNGGLFVTLCTTDAQAKVILRALYEHLAKAGIFTRWGYESDDALPAWLRLGLPADDGARLQLALECFI
ncbi:threonine-phosphate decarboxylase [Gilvimarinus sp. 1_MG-2023]|uniref:threonine-phosphate decarboxylase n=1 Tax=Gilvimarinus sp. 1_MG-2023 TaxID=3062638 RepID=UPI0026E32BE8|nr:threonine-phosphate decarboxylase [Gilvimarinus sp. 1_MG-2023]MDO6747957.1 pyridoxal phosphate-dependent class II aminotransferase [Gilvimarinus sp. 1_MG-2023]